MLVSSFNTDIYFFTKQKQRKGDKSNLNNLSNAYELLVMIRRWGLA